MTKIYNNYANIKEVKQKMNDKIEELYKELTIIESKIKDTKKDFDTPMARKFRIKAEELINNERKTLNNQLVPYVNNLDAVSKRYEKAYNELNKSTQGE